MTSHPSIATSEWNDGTERLPTWEDFVTHEGDCFAEWAWEYFGSLTRTEAYDRFCDFPRNYAEDFMSMGGKAFAYYYPVIERYLIESSVTWGDDEVDGIWILAGCIDEQFRRSFTVKHVSHLRLRVQSLVQFVRGNLPKFCTESAGQKEVDEAWMELEQRLAGLQ